MTRHATAIEWTHVPGYRGESWNPIVGCRIVSPGCTNCYAMKMAARLERMGVPKYARLTRDTRGGPAWTGEIRLADEKTLLSPTRATKPRAYFVNSMGDLFAEGVPTEAIDAVFQVMGACPQHIFIILTKRAEAMRDYMRARARGAWNGPRLEPDAFPPHNVWLGVSAEDQRRADERVPVLLETPAAVRFVSCEPLLGPVDLDQVRAPEPNDGDWQFSALDANDMYFSKLWREPGDGANRPRLDWVIAGGESDTDGKSARPMHPDWARSLRDQCAAAGVPFLFKQWGNWLHESQDSTHRFDWTDADERNILHIWSDEPQTASIPVSKAAAGRLLDGVVHDAFPACVTDPEARRAIS